MERLLEDNNSELKETVVDLLKELKQRTDKCKTKRFSENTRLDSEDSHLPFERLGVDPIDISQLNVSNIASDNDLLKKMTMALLELEGNNSLSKLTEVFRHVQDLQTAWDCRSTGEPLAQMGLWRMSCNPDLEYMGYTGLDNTVQIICSIQECCQFYNFELVESTVSGFE